MEDIKLEYSKDWRNPADFPTVEPDETKVREDLQLLYNEIQTFLNDRLIPIMKELENPGIEHLPVENTVSTSKEKIPTSYAVAHLFASQGNMPAGGAAGQFLVKLSDDYADASWATYKIPGRASDLIAVDEEGKSVNAQALLSRITEDLYRSAQASDPLISETIASGDVQNGSFVDIPNLFEYESIMLRFDREGEPSQSPAAVYLGEWNGLWDEREGGVTAVNEEGMWLLSAMSFSLGSSSSVSAEIKVIPNAEGVLVRYQQGTRFDGVNSFYDGLFVCEAPSSAVPRPTRLTLFSSAIKHNTDDTAAQIRYTVYGIRHGKIPEVN